MDLDTFLTQLYVQVDDWYKSEMAEQVKRPKAGTQKLTDSEVLTIALVGQWQVGVPWRSERGLVRYLQAHGRGWFPKMLERSAFNQRVRQLCMVLAALQRWIVTQIEEQNAAYEVEDGVPLPVCSVGQMQREKGHWLGQHSSLGHGGTGGGWFYGQRWWVSVNPSGLITGWLVGAAHLNERWLQSAFLSARAQHGFFTGPAPDTGQSYHHRPQLPAGFIGGFFAVGDAQSEPYLTDRGLNGSRWQRHWWQTLQARVIAVPPSNVPEFQHWTRADCLWLAHHRQVIETVFALLTKVFGLKQVNAHSLWGQYTRLAAKAAAFNLALWFNRLLGRPPFAIETLII
jgi:hypothetical protein